MNLKKYVIVFAVLLVAFVLAGSVADATHSWGGYHWARTSNPFTLKLGDNVTSAWDAYLGTTSIDWSLSSMLDTAIIVGQTNPKNCRAVKGKVQVCNSAYGNNNWLGVAQIWVSGSHIVQGTVKVNDTYFNTPTYNTSAWRNLVMCQEVGHTLGLNHQDEIFGNANLGTCMDYTNDPSTNQHPNTHDYDQLALIYAHLTDGINTVFLSTNGIGNGKPATIGQDIDLSDPSAWGKAVKKDARGNNSLYERDLGKDEKLFTFVIWVK